MAQFDGVVDVVVVAVGDSGCLVELTIVWWVSVGTVDPPSQVAERGRV